MFIKIKNILAKSISRLGVENQINKIKVCETSKKIIHKNFFKKSRAVTFNIKDFKNGTLEVVCDNSAFAGEMMLKNNLIISEINQKLDRDLPKVGHIRLKIY